MTPARPAPLSPPELARRAARRAYVPYSSFPVGAVLEDAQGRLHPGANVECASIGLSICAERVAVALAWGRGARRFRRLWVYTPTRKPTSPCGACREVLSRLAPDLTIVLLTNGGRGRAVRLDALFPRARRRGRPGRSGAR
jgi:cytidine deaminase